MHRTDAPTEGPSPATAGLAGKAPASRDNAAVAQMLREMADLLEAQGEANVYRCAAYRRAADTVARWPRAVSDVFG